MPDNLQQLFTDPCPGILESMAGPALAEHVADVLALTQSSERDEETNDPALRPVLKRNRSGDCKESPLEDPDVVEPPCKKQPPVEDIQMLLQQLKTLRKQLELEKGCHQNTQSSLWNAQQQQAKLQEQLEETKTQLNRTNAYLQALGTKHLAVCFNHQTKHPECSSCTFTMRTPEARTQPPAPK